MSQLHLEILPQDKELWENHPTYINALENNDCGLDIPCPDTVTVPKNSMAFTINLGFKAAPNYGYMLVPRSSISKTPLRLANSIGIIDINYRGDVMVKVDNNTDDDFTVEKGKCYFQIIAFNGMTPKFSIVENIDETKRGEGGFGSTTM